MKTPFRDKMEWETFEIFLKSGRIIKHYPDKGDNLVSKEDVISILDEYGMYEVTLGNYRKLWVEKDDIEYVK